ncbi:MAG TPA: hypothetical protein ENI62_04990 [Gammaproteobacteria bacterium]|nr:hypothetical protein [Gammaproteobacteria bacterium]
MRKLYSGLLAVILSSSLLVANSSFAASNVFEPKHKIVIQVSTDNVRTQNIALNNAVNLQKALGLDNVAIEVVAYGPGLSMLTRKSKIPARVTSLALQNITFSACHNTMKKVAKKTGKMPVLLDGVRVVPAGVLRIMELQEQGYTYIRP